MSSWVLDAMYTLGGYESVRPDRVPWHELNGYDHNDFESVFRLARSVDGFPKAYAEVANQVAFEAARAAEAGHTSSAARLYHRAALLYGRGQYHLFADSEAKSWLHDRSRECYDRVIAAADGRIQRRRTAFEGHAVHAILHTPVAPASGLVMVLPGMDAFKEERHVTAQLLVERGVAAAVLDGPGQGESLVGGLKVTIDNYERAVAAVVTDLADDLGNVPVGILGTSMGSYWASRATAYEPRIRACAVAMGCYGPMRHMFTAARPAFRDNYKYMTGIDDDTLFDAFVQRMEITALASEITTPYLVVHGEYDELNPLGDAIAWFSTVPSPKELWVYEDEYHPMGRRAGDFLLDTIDWLCDRVLGRVTDAPDHDVRTFIRSRERGGARTPFRTPADLIMSGAPASGHVPSR